MTEMIAIIVGLFALVIIIAELWAKRANRKQTELERLRKDGRL